jgi:hypothetical protein
MPFDYSQALAPRDFSELIPHGTIATVQMRVRPGNVGEDGILKRTKAGDAEFLDAEFVLVDGPHAKRKVFDNFLLAGTTPGQQEMVQTNRGRLKQILESAHGIRPGDASERARKVYSASLKDFDNLIFIAKIGVRKGGPKNDGSGESWSDKNVLLGAVGPEHKEWHPVEQPPPFNGGGAGATATPPAGASTTTAAGSTPITPPKWAQ